MQNQTIEKTQINASRGIDTLERVNLNGVNQWMLIRGWHRSNPVLLFLHGGPGAPLFPYARKIGVNAGLEEHFVMVYWEQRGTGKSFAFDIPEETMTIRQFVEDTHDLTNRLRSRFNRSKIFLVARSWGSLIGIMTAKRYPQLYHAYVGIGQIVNPLEGDRRAYLLTLKLAREAGNEEAIADLKNIGQPPYNDQELVVQRKWLTKFYKNFMAEKFAMSNTNEDSFVDLLSTPEYSVLDIIKMGFDPFFSIKNLWDENFYDINLIENIPALQVPVYFLVGRYDYFASPELVEKYYHQLSAPEDRHLIWFENSGHEPELTEPDKFRQIMVNQVLSVNKSDSI